jgi:hypothetical protein
MQALQLFGILLVALFSNKQKRQEQAILDQQEDMVTLEAMVDESPEAETEWIVEDFAAVEESIAEYDAVEIPAELPAFEEAEYTGEVDAGSLAPTPPSPIDSSAMNYQAQWVTRVKEFGVLPTGPAAEYVFRFTNTGNSPITIAEAAPSCSCTVSDFTKTPIAPGQEGWVKAVYETQGHPGFFKKFIRVEFADGSGTQLIVTGSVQ